MTMDREESAPNAGGISSVPTLALRSGLSGEFIDFGNLPRLLADMEPASGRKTIVARWAAILKATGTHELGIDPYLHSSFDEPAWNLAAEGAWRFAERMGFIASGRLTDSGHKVAAIMKLNPFAGYRTPLAPILAESVQSALVGQGGLPIVPLLRRATQALAASENLWVRECPGLLPVEVGAIVHWACVDIERARILVRDIGINRDLAMRWGGPPDAGSYDNASKLSSRVSDFYLNHSDLGQRVPFSSGEELALARLLVYCGLFEEFLLDLIGFYLV